METYPYARDAVREGGYHALIHCNWADHIPIQIRIEDDAMLISNSCMLPFGWTEDTLLGPHGSKPYNPDIARFFYRAGYIESWGRGIEKIHDACQRIGAPVPEYYVHGEDIMLKLMALERMKVTEKVTDTERVILDLLGEKPDMTYDELAEAIKTSRKTISERIKNLKKI